MKLFGYKRLYLVVLLTMLFFLFFQTDWLWKWMYPVKYSEDIKISAEAYEIDPLLVAAIIRVESNYNPGRKSDAGAVGLMQIMPSTASWIVEQGGYPDLTLRRLERPDVNIEIGCWYVNTLMRKFNGNQIAVIAAYNAGPTKVSEWIRKGTWDGSYGNRDRVPFGETRHYIQRVIYYYNKYKKVYSEL